MKRFSILPDAWFAGHCTSGNSDKVWAACLAVETDETATAPALAEETELAYLCVYGAHGANLRVEAPQLLPSVQAHKLFQKKRRKKESKGYQPVPFQLFLAAFGHPAGLPLVWPGSPSSLEGEQKAETMEQTSVTPDALDAQARSVFRYPAALVKPLPENQLQLRYADPGYGLTEKVNGERCLLEVEGTQIRAYNRKGRVMLNPPAGAQALTSPDGHWVVDGERLTGKFAGTYVIFDLLEGDHEPLLDLPYQERISLLIDCLHHDGLLKEKRCTPTLRQALANSTIPDLAVLGPVSGASEMQAVYAAVQAEGGEGVIFRKLACSYQDGAEKVKFLADLDAFVFGIQPGHAGGSLRLGVIRPGDQAVVEVGHVRSGLGMPEMKMIQRWVTEGGFPVFTVQYLAARTTGLHLVEPRTSLSLLRTDKDPRDCSSEQFGPEKAPLVAQAIPITGIIVPGMEEETGGQEELALSAPEGGAIRVPNQPQEEIPF